MRVSRAQSKPNVLQGQFFLRCVSQFSPRIEETFADKLPAVSYSTLRHGTPVWTASNIGATSPVLQSISAGFRVSVAVSHNFDTARIKAVYARGITVIPRRHEAHFSCAQFRLMHCDLMRRITKHLCSGELGTLGELAELPEEELITRLGQQAKLWLKLSRGMAEHTFQPIEAKFELKEHLEFETHIEQIDSLLFIAANMINNLVSRAASRALSLATLTVHMGLDKHPTYQRAIRPAIPSSDRKFLLKLLQLEIAAHPPQAAIFSFTLTAEAGQQSKMQLGLFAPQTPEPSRLDVTLARLKALVGDDRVGSPY